MSFAKILTNIGCTALSTVAPPIGGMAANIIKKTLKLDDNADEVAINQALETMTPEQVKSIKQAEYDFKVKLKSLNIDLAEIDAKDRDSARKREMTLRDKTPAILATLVTLGFFGLLGTLFMLDAKNVTVLNVMIGSLGTAWVAIINYYFGSSHGSQKKNEMLANK
jgi:hypothetical protein